MEFVSRALAPPESSYFLLGPRGTGKSMLVRHFHPDALWVDLLEPGVLRTYQARPERLGELVAGHPASSDVVIDEVQRVPDLLSVVHALIEQPRPLRFILTGSSARKLKRGGVDLLAGRAHDLALHPFLASELGDRFNLEDALRRGLLPVVLAAHDPAETLRAYVGLYVREEVQMEGLVRNVGAFSRFLEAISFSHAAVLNVSNVARECEVERKTAASFVEILEDLHLGFRLPVFTRRARRATTRQPKFYLFDAGVFRSLRPVGPLDRPETIDGAALEGLVAQHLRAWIDYSGRRHALSFWRTQGGSEIDFVLYGPDTFLAIEVKNAARIGSFDLRALCTFRADYPESRQVLLYRGSDRFVRNGVLCLPVAEFLSDLRPGRLPVGGQ